MSMYANTNCYDHISHIKCPHSHCSYTDHSWFESFKNVKRWWGLHLWQNDMENMLTSVWPGQWWSDRLSMVSIAVVVGCGNERVLLCVHVCWCQSSTVQCHRQWPGSGSGLSTADTMSAHQCSTMSPSTPVFMLPGQTADPVISQPHLQRSMGLCQPNCSQGGRPRPLQR